MQIKKIIIYNKDNKKRVMTFQTGEINVIVGPANTGKSAILNIIDFCLGTHNLKIAGDVIDTNALYFAVILRLVNGEILLVRKNHTLSSDTEMMLIQSNQEIQVPEEIILERFDKSIGDVRAELESITGINSQTPLFNKKEKQQPASFELARLYCFQPKTDIDQKDILFYGQRNKVLGAIKTTLPYFLQTTNIALNKLIEKKRIKEEVQTKLIAQKKEINDQIQAQKITMDNMFKKAMDFNLIERDALIQNDAEKLQILKSLNMNILQESPNISLLELENITERKKFLEEQKRILNIQYEEAQSKLSQIKTRHNKAKEENDEIRTYIDAAQLQLERLQSINIIEPSLFADEDKKQCPLCESKLEHDIPTVSVINESINKLQKNINITDIEVKKAKETFLRKILTELKNNEKNVNNLLASISNINMEIGKLNPIQTNFDNEKQKFIGSLTTFRDMIQVIKLFSDEEQLQLDKLNNTISDLKKDIEREGSNNLLEVRLKEIEDLMTTWAKDLPFEFSNNKIEFKLDSLTLRFTNDRSRCFYLENTTGQQNSIIAHLLIHFALHTVFITENSPVPRFLILDRFLSPFDDRNKDIVFQFINDRVKELATKLQVIIIEKEDLQKNKIYQQSIVKEWNNNRVLIPNEWLNSEGIN